MTPEGQWIFLPLFFHLSIHLANIARAADAAPARLARPLPEGTLPPRVRIPEHARLGAGREPPAGRARARRGRARVLGPRPLGRDAAGRAARAPLGGCCGGWCGRSHQGWEEEEVRGESSERDMRHPGRKRERVRRRSEL